MLLVPNRDELSIFVQLEDVEIGCQVFLSWPLVGPVIVIIAEFDLTLDRWEGYLITT